MKVGQQITPQFTDKTARHRAKEHSYAEKWSIKFYLVLGTHLKWGQHSSFTLPKNNTNDKHLPISAMPSWGKADVWGHDLHSIYTVFPGFKQHSPFSHIDLVCTASSQLCISPLDSLKPPCNLPLVHSTHKTMTVINLPHMQSITQLYRQVLKTPHFTLSP